MTLAETMRKASKAAVLPAGLVTRRRSGDIVVLLYHRVGVGRSEIDMPTGAFERHIAALAAREHVRSLTDALANDEGGVVVTFDDGYRDFYDHALPLLVRHSVPAVLYLATGLIDGVSPNALGLSWAQLAEAVSTGLVTIGSHTHGHADLSRADERSAEDEMRRSKELIEDRLGVACSDFAYPWAVGSAEADRVARRLFRTAALGAWRMNRRGRTDPYRISRMPVLRSDGQLFFRAKVAGRLGGEALLYRAARRGPWRPR